MNFFEASESIQQIHEFNMNLINTKNSLPSLIHSSQFLQINWNPKFQLYT